MNMCGILRLVAVRKSRGKIVRQGGVEAEMVPPPP
jgi:hypothetical protein